MKKDFQFCTKACLKTLCRNLVDFGQFSKDTILESKVMYLSESCDSIPTEQQEVVSTHEFNSNTLREQKDCSIWDL